MEGWENWEKVQGFEIYFSSYGWQVCKRGEEESYRLLNERGEVVAWGRDVDKLIFRAEEMVENGREVRGRERERKVLRTRAWKSGLSDAEWVGFKREVEGIGQQVGEFLDLVVRDLLRKREEVRGDV